MSSTVPYRPSAPTDAPGKARNERRQARSAAYWRDEQYRAALLDGSTAPRVVAVIAEATPEPPPEPDPAPLERPETPGDRLPVHVHVRLLKLGHGPDVRVFLAHRAASADRSTALVWQHVGDWLAARRCPQCANLYGVGVSDTLAAFAAQLPDVVIALDFDGPLAPIVANPQQSRPLPGAIDTLAKLASSGVQVAIVTGRDVETVLRLGQLASIPNVIVSGVHGAQTWQAGQLTTKAEPEGLADLRVQLPPLLSEVDTNLWLEDKRLSLVVHARLAADPVEALAKLSPSITNLAERVGLEVHPGKLVLEIRMPNLSKADAMEELLALRPSAALFAGDDVGDIPAFTVVREWASRTGRPGLAIAVGDINEVCKAANLQVDNSRELLSLLSELARTLDG